MSEVLDDPLRDPALYSSRELAQLDFNFRVLAQAQDPEVPLLERLRFLCIASSNLEAILTAQTRDKETKS